MQDFKHDKQKYKILLLLWMISKVFKHDFCNRFGQNDGSILYYLLTWFETYSQTWANDHLRIVTTLFGSPNFNSYNMKLPLNNDHLSIMATKQGFRGWSLYPRLTVIDIVFKTSTTTTMSQHFLKLTNRYPQPKQRGLVNLTSVLVSPFQTVISHKTSIGTLNSFQQVRRWADSIKIY